jgi:hypothetical protein
MPCDTFGPNWKLVRLWNEAHWKKQPMIRPDTDG